MSILSHHAADGVTVDMALKVFILFSTVHLYHHSDILIQILNIFFCRLYVLYVNLSQTHVDNFMCNIESEGQRRTYLHVFNAHVHRTCSPKYGSNIQ